MVRVCCSALNLMILGKKQAIQKQIPKYASGDSWDVCCNKKVLSIYLGFQHDQRSFP